MTGAFPVWILLGPNAGDNNQLIRLAEALGRSYRSVQLDYNPLHLLQPRLLGASLASLTPESRRMIEPPWPELVLGIGYRSVPVALAIRQRSGGRAKLVRLGYPRLDSSDFDLVITTPQYRARGSEKLVQLPVGIPTAPILEPTPEERDWLARLARPHRLLVIGGDTFMWTLDPAAMAAASTLIAGKRGGSTIAVSSPRSDERVLCSVEAALDGSPHALVWDRSPRYPVLLADADEIYVTGDSVSMTSEAIATGHPVGIIDPSRTLVGRGLYALSDTTGMRVPLRDIRRFINSLRDQGLAGTVDAPMAGKLDIDPLQLAVDAIRKL